MVWSDERQPAGRERIGRQGTKDDPQENRRTEHRGSFQARHNDMGMFRWGCENDPRDAGFCRAKTKRKNDKAAGQDRPLKRVKQRLGCGSF